MTSSADYKLDLSLTPDLSSTFGMAAKVGRAYLSTVMLLGESGVGKTRIARHIHENSSRAGKPFQIIDLSQATPSVFESEFFGHEKGSFTGATQMHKSPFELADGGTVFLDEIGTLSFDLQARLLRLVQEKKFKRVGGREDITVDVRIIAATSLDLAEKVRRGEFREDLYHRLNVIQISVPALRFRRNDIVPLAEYFLHQASKNDKLPQKTLSPEAKVALRSYDWPGNVRALENEMSRATILADGKVIQIEDLSFLQSASHDFPVHDHQVHDDFARRTSYAAVIEELVGIGDFSLITAACNEAKRYLLERSIQEAVVDGKETKQADAARFLNCVASSMGSYAHLLFNLEDQKFSSLVTHLPKWVSERDDFSYVELSRAIANAVVDENAKFPSMRKNMIKTIDEDILYPVKIALIKAALVDNNFSQLIAAKVVGHEKGYINVLMLRDTQFAQWFKENAPAKGSGSSPKVEPR